MRRKTMAFVDEVTIYVKSGKGGDGVVRWLRTKETARGGPSGGDGGKGGDVVFVGVRDLSALTRYRYAKKFFAHNGEDGKNDQRHGANGHPLVLPVSIGTSVRVTATGDEHEIIREGERLALFQGGRGGLGNAHFKSSTNQNPFEYTLGREGRGGEVELTLKLIADAGLVGLPNAGKSSLLNALTRSKSKVGSYPFTTLEPHLGEFHSFILADIPGLIEGASSGRGLGIKFLKHIERTRVLLHLVSAEQDDPLVSYREVVREMELFGRGLEKKHEVIVLSKADLISPGNRKERIRALASQTGREVLPVSVTDLGLLKAFSNRLSNILGTQ